MGKEDMRGKTPILEMLFINISESISYLPDFTFLLQTGLYFANAR